MLSLFSFPHATRVNYRTGALPRGTQGEIQLLRYIWARPLACRAWLYPRPRCAEGSKQGLNNAVVPLHHRSPSPPALRSSRVRAAKGAENGVELSAGVCVVPPARQERSTRSPDAPWQPPARGPSPLPCPSRALLFLRCGFMSLLYNFMKSSRDKIALASKEMRAE